MKRIKEHEGITLIALIITIIVLLIIAVVTIGEIQNSKIITYAQNAADDYNKEKEKEESTIAGYESLIEQYVPKVPKIEYYIVDNIIQKVDRNSGIGIVYATYDGKIKETMRNNFYEDTPTNEIKTIKVQDNITAEVKDEELAIGAIPLISADGNLGGYFSDNKLYGASGNGIYSIFELVTDKSEIARIEAEIANINQ